MIVKVIHSKTEMDVCKDKIKIDMLRKAEEIVHEAPEAQRKLYERAGSGFSMRFGFSYCSLFI